MKRRDRATATLQSAVLSSTAALGGTIDLGEPVKDHTVQAVFTTTAVITSTLTYSLYGSLDGSHWFSLADHEVTSAEFTANGFMFHVADKPVTYVKGGFSSATFSTTVGTKWSISATYLAHSW